MRSLGNNHSAHLVHRLHRSFSLSYFQIQLIFTTYATKHQAYARTNIRVIYKNIFGQDFFLSLNFFKQINSRSVSWEWDGVNISGVEQCYELFLQDERFYDC